MRLKNTVALAALMSWLAACNQAPSPAVENSVVETSPPADTVAVSNKLKTACELIGLQEAARILGTQVTATPDEGVQRTGCVWQAVGRGMPYLELKIEYGDGEAAIMASGMLHSHEPEINQAYAGLGDQAFLTGPAVMIKQGEDLFTITPLGVNDPEAVTREVFKIAVGRLQTS